MPRLPRLLPFVVLAMSGCQGLRGCGSSESAHQVSAASTPDASTPSVAPPPPEARYARNWLVILHSSPTPGEGTEVLEALKKTGLPAEPSRLSSNAFRSLRPCLEVVVAHAFADKAKAEGFQKRLAEAGVGAYVKNAGPLDPDRERKEATCRAEAQAVAARVEAQRLEVAPRLVEVHAGRTFMLLGKAGDNVGLTPVDEGRRLWMAPAEKDPTDQFAQGDTVDLYGAAGRLQSGCAVTGFAWINRGVPHSGYFQREPPSNEPGCGRAWAFAELDCGMTPSDLSFALPVGTKAPVFFTLESPSTEEVADQESELRRSARFATLRSEGSVRAEQVQEKLQEDVRATRYSAREGEHHVVFTVAHFITGEGNSACGSDYNEQLTRAVVRGPGGEQRVLTASDLNGDEVAGVMDLEGDGQVEVLLHASWPAQRVRLIREDGTELAGTAVENCDSGC
ncbi:MAG TPA: hypothetical protein VF794_35955 [Archangium sp.]|uniref:hypothetical protein n=1 Tax=Archangium sp. TaxID=1872627 RepID=UPI002ED8AF24